MILPEFLNKKLIKSINKLQIILMKIINLYK